MLKLFARVLSVLAILHGVTTDASAAVCAAQTASDARDKADTVFRGIVREVNKEPAAPVPANRSTSTERYSVRFEVLAYWKGRVRPRVTLTHVVTKPVTRGVSPAASVQGELAMGKEYLVFVNRIGNDLVLDTSECAKTRLAENQDAKKDIAALGPARTP